MTSSQTPNPLEAPTSAHAPIFSEPEVVTAVVVPDLDPAKAAAVFSNPL
jgi:hypothetical protein